MPIEDENRAALAYNMLYAMVDNGAECTIDGYRIKMNTDQLSVADSAGESFKPELDPEWYGTVEQKQQLWGQMEEKNENMTEYCLSEYDSLNELIQITPVTYDYHKANEMFNFTKRGMNRDVSYHIKTADGTLHDVNVTSAALTDGEGFIVTERTEWDWTKGQMDENVVKLDDGQNFADAVAGISVSEQTMEQ